MPRITPPDQYEFTRTLPIAALNDTEAECDFSAEGGSVTLEAITICGKLFLIADFCAWLGTYEASLLEEAAVEWWMSEGWAAAEQDWLASVADAQNEARDDD